MVREVRGQSEAGSLQPWGRRGEEAVNTVECACERKTEYCPLDLVTGKV